MAESIRNKPLQLGTYHMANNSTYEPQRTNNFELQITGLEGLLTKESGGRKIASNAGQLITLSVDSFSAPNINIGTIQIPYGNNKIKFAGLPEFTDSTVSINDYIGIDMESILCAWHRLVYDTNTQKVGLAYDKTKGYKKIAYLIEYDPQGGSARQWKLSGCWPTNLTLGEFRQEGGAVRQIQMTLVYDYIQNMD